MASTTTTSKECRGCRLVSFCGLVGAGCYVGYYARQQKTVLGKGVLGAFALGLAYIGTARLVNIYPFHNHRKSTSSSVGSSGGMRQAE